VAISRHKLQRDIRTVTENQGLGRACHRASARQAEETIRNRLIFQDFLNGVPIKQIAHSVGISTIRVNQIVRREGRRALPSVGQRIMTAPLSEVRQILREDMSAAQLQVLPKSTKEE
jgi:Mor family transcriptional regulator